MRGGLDPGPRDEAIPFYEDWLLCGGAARSQSWHQAQEMPTPVRKAFLLYDRLWRHAEAERRQQ